MLNSRIRTALAQFALLSLSASPALAEDWVKIGASDAGTWEGKTGSAHIAKNNSKEDVVIGAGRFIDSKTYQVDFEQWYVRLADCQRGAGKLVTADINGNFQWDTDFVLKGGSVASSIADVLCGIASERQGKGLPS